MSQDTERTHAGNAAAPEMDDRRLRAFYDTHAARVYRFALARLSGDHGAAEEIVCDVFIHALRDLESCQDEDPRRWLMGIARHRLLDHQRCRERDRARARALATLDEASVRRLARIENDVLPEAVVEREETREIIEIALAGLSPQYERVLRLRYLEELPVNEIAGIVESTDKAVESQLYRARIAFANAFTALVSDHRLQGTGNS